MLPVSSGILLECCSLSSRRALRKAHNISNTTRLHGGMTKADIQLKKRVNCAVYGSGLSASGALAIPKLVVNDNAVTSKEAHRPLRINHFNLREIKKISAGFGFSLFASRDKLYGAGLNNCLQISSHLLGENKGQDYYISAKRISLPGEGRIRSISSGRAHSLVATSAGLFAFGDNCHGQCGRDPVEYPHVVGRDNIPLPPIMLPTSSPIISVHCSLDTSFVLTESGEIFSFGLNEDGQCANGEYGIQTTPTKIIGDANGEDIIWIGGSTDTILALSKKGDVFIWGQCEYGQAGTSTDQVQLNTSLRLPFSFGKIATVGASMSSCVASTVDGEVYVWGVGLVGLGPKNQRISRPTLLDQPLFDNHKVDRVFAGNTSMAAINAEGRLFLWGHNRYGLLGLGHGKDQYFPYQVYLPSDTKDVALGPDHSLFLVK